MKILIADDHPLFRAGIRHALLQLEDRIEIIEACDHEQVVAKVTTHGDLSLLLLDLHMPGVDGLAALESLIKRFPALPILVLSASENRVDMQRAFEYGAVGFVPKATAPAVVLGAVRLALDGGIYVPPVFLQSPLQSPVSVSTIPALTRRQIDVLALVLQGKSNKAIATELGLSEATVKTHVTAVFKALRVNNRTQAALAANKLQLFRS